MVPHPVQPHCPTKQCMSYLSASGRWGVPGAAGRTGRCAARRCRPSYTNKKIRSCQGQPWASEFGDSNATNSILLSGLDKSLGIMIQSRSYNLCDFAHCNQGRCDARTALFHEKFPLPYSGHILPDNIYAHKILHFGLVLLILHRAAAESDRRLAKV